MSWACNHPGVWIKSAPATAGDAVKKPRSCPAGTDPVRTVALREIRTAGRGWWRSKGSRQSARHPAAFFLSVQAGYVV